LKTDKGDFYLYQPYSIPFNDTLSSGFFFVDAGVQTSPAEAFSEDDHVQPITYTGYLTSDVELGGVVYYGARIYISFDANPHTVKPFSDGTLGFLNEVGKAHVRVISGNSVITADLAPNQIYVYFDITNSSVGFGSYAGGRGYPLSLTANGPPLTANSLVGAVSDIIVNQDPLNYSPNTAALAKRMEAAPLAGKTTLSGPACSCIAFDPTTSICSNFTPVPLSTTNLGSLYLFEPYTVDACTYRITIPLFSTALDNACNSSPTDGPLFISVNWGSFWVEVED